MHGIIGAALFAVIDDVDAAFDLLLHDMRDRFAHRGGKLGLARAGILLFGEQQFDHLGGARQAAGVGGENPIGAAFHNRPLLPCGHSCGPAGLNTGAFPVVSQDSAEIRTRRDRIALCTPMR